MRRTALSAVVLGVCLFTLSANAQPNRGSRVRPRGRHVTKYQLNGQAFQGQFGWNPGSVKRMLSVEVHHPALPGGKDMVGTHVFKNPARNGQKEPTVIPAHDDLGQVSFASGGKLVRGDHALAKKLRPGQFAFMIHQRQANQQYAGGKVDLTAGVGGEQSKELSKLWDTHISIAVGIKRPQGIPGRKKLKAGVATLNMPQGYPGGDFGAGRLGLYEGGQWAYGNLTMAVPKFPSYVGKGEVKQFTRNMRTMLAGFDAVGVFPGDYNGGDPLANKTPADIRNAVKMMIQGVAGTPTEKRQAQAFFSNPLNKLYCAELAYTAASAAVHVPLNDATVIGKLGVSQETWKSFKKEIGKHNSGRSSAFTAQNSAENPMIKNVKLGVSSSKLKPLPEYAPASIRAAERNKMAFAPMTAADIVANALAVQFPRSKWGERAGSRVQSDAWGAMRQGIMAQLQGNGDRGGMTDQQRTAVNTLLDGVGQVIATPHADYNAFRRAMSPLLAQARQIPGLQFTPPHLFHLNLKAADRTWINRGLLGLEYGGTVVNAKLLDRKLEFQPAQ
jgi:hypothetical protein